ncbi:hypothetical protein COLO4_27408 [Corchorus olitorius]|uniref:Uncharacterized protein n=1 Tax=Corchorus olitorius TaxID=93759 RepID=A0A1R3HRS1_9ROSI|nr:hypothetical protein COLO4_27408 [Corchorus olitorius]
MFSRQKIPSAAEASAIHRAEASLVTELKPGTSPCCLLFRFGTNFGQGCLQRHQLSGLTSNIPKENLLSEMLCDDKNEDGVFEWENPESGQ